MATPTPATGPTPSSGTAYYIAISCARTTEPDPAALLTQLRSQVDPTIGVRHEPGSAIYTLKKTATSDWTAGQSTAALAIIQNAVPMSAQTIAQAEIDAWPMVMKALVLAVIDQLNVLRAAQKPALSAITPAQALQAIREKIGSL